MIEILVYNTDEEAKQQLEKYERDNREAFEGFIKRQSESASERLGKQTYFFVAELAAYIDDGPGKFYFESAVFPFLGWNDLHDDIQSLVQGVKGAVRHQTPKNIETILYVVENHDAKNREFKKNARDGRKEAEKYRSPDGVYGDERHDISEEEWDKMLEVLERHDISEEEWDKMLEVLESTEERGLTKTEREEFVRLYERL